MKKISKSIKILLIILAILGVFLAAGLLVIRNVYQTNLGPVSTSETSKLVEIPLGSTTAEIAKLLESSGVVKKAWAFEWYIRNNDYNDSLKAGTYSLRPNMGVVEVVEVLTKGQIATELFTILPGQRIDQIKESFINAGFTPESVEVALDPQTYTGHPALVDKPLEASLEGYLYPETFQRTAATTATDIVKVSLDELQSQLTPQLRSAINKQGYTLHEAIIIASIVEQEVSDPDDKPTVAQVFMKRRDVGMMLGSDVTAFYGAIVDGSSDTDNVFYDSPYNTRLYTGFPPGPISNVSLSSLQAVANPSDTDFLFFVAGDDGVTYFSRTNEEHEALTREHCTILCQ